MKKIVLLMAAAFVLFVACSGGSDGAMSFVPVVTGAVSNPYNGKIVVKNFSKYAAIGAAATKSGTSANVEKGISANTSGEEAKDIHLVGQAFNGAIESLSMQKDGQDSAINERPLQFFRAFKRFVFFMYWPEGNSYYSDYGKLFDYPKVFIAYTGGRFSRYEPMLVLDKSNGKIYAIDNSEFGANANDLLSKWDAFNNESDGTVEEGGDRFYIYYTRYNNSKLCVNYYALKLTEDNLQETYIVRDADSGLFSGMCVDRFGNLFTDGNSRNIKYYMAIDGNKTKINYADNLHCYSSNTVFNISVYYYSDGTFSMVKKTDISSQVYSNYYSGDNRYLLAMTPIVGAPLFMAANGYVYQACNNSNTRDGVYKRFNGNGQLEACDWVPPATQEISFSPNELLIKKDNVEYYFVSSIYDYFNNRQINSLTATVSNIRLINSSGQPATVKKYDFGTGKFTQEDIPVVLDSYSLSWYNNSYDSRKRNVIYKVQYTDSSRNQFTITEIPLVDITYEIYNYASTSKHIFFVKDGDLVAINIEDGTKCTSCCKSDAIYGSVSASASKDKVFFTATSLSSNASISGTIDDNGNVIQNSTNYEIKYLSPIN